MIGSPVTNNEFESMTQFMNDLCVILSSETTVSGEHRLLLLLRLRP
jgi:hypothetical protein